MDLGLSIFKVRRPAPKAARSTPITEQVSYQGTEHGIAIGASTGGIEVIRVVLESLPVGMPGIVMTQHMPPGFTTSYAAKLDRLSRLRVQEVKGGERYCLAMPILPLATNTCWWSVTAQTWCASCPMPNRLTGTNRQSM